MASVLAICLGVLGFFRVLITTATSTSFLAILALSVSLCLIVFLSVMIGTALPFALRRLGFDPVHAGPIIQVLMDLLGVIIDCFVFQAFLGKGTN